MAETIVQIAHGNLYIKCGSAQDALLLMAAAEDFLLKGEDHLQIAEMEIDALTGSTTGAQQINVEIDSGEIAAAILEFMSYENTEDDEEEEGE